MMTQPVILTSLHDTSCGRYVAHASLNSPKTLNALTQDMVEQLHHQLREWAADERILAVVLGGEGERALCAGGDIKRLHELALNGDQGREFFAKEYALDYYIHTYPKPLIVWGKGIVMGGGLGLLAEAPYRVVTQSTRIAMPEVTIGLYPDVGGSYFLARAPEKYGLFMGLTGCSINAADAVEIGMADFRLDDEQFGAFISTLCAADWSEDTVVAQTLTNLASIAEPQQPYMTKYKDAINELCSADSLEEVMANISSLQSDEKFLLSAQKKCLSGCPMTAHLVWQQIQRAKAMSLHEVFEMEWVMSVNCLSNSDFPEGVRALVLDKDQQPKWAHSDVNAVPAEFVNQHFRLDEPNQFLALSPK